MGKRAREIRTAVKGFANKLGYQEDELGELKVTLTKAEARRRFLEWKWNLSFLVVETARDLRVFYEVHKASIRSDLLARMGSLVVEEIDAQILSLLV
jgi:hypothetical protein